MIGYWITSNERNKELWGFKNGRDHISPNEIKESFMVEATSMIKFDA